MFANTKAEEIFSYSKDEFVGLSIEQLIPKRFRDSHKKIRKVYSAAPTETAMAGGRVLIGLRKSSEEVRLQIGLNTLNDKYILVSLIETNNAIIKPSISNDPLTGLANRKTFDELSQKLWQLAIRQSCSISIAFIDLDNFKAVNDQYGHPFGDKLIIKVAQLLAKHIRESDILARIGGDEFVICYFDISDPEKLRDRLKNLMEQIASLNEIDGKAFKIGASIGAVMTKALNKWSTLDLIGLADTLMYQVKNDGKGKVKVKSLG